MQVGRCSVAPYLPAPCGPVWGLCALQVHSCGCRPSAVHSHSSVHLFAHWLPVPSCLASKVSGSHSSVAVVNVAVAARRARTPSPWRASDRSPVLTWPAVP